MAVFRRRQPLDGVEPEKLQLIFGMLRPFAVVREPFVTPNQDMTIADFRCIEDHISLWLRGNERPSKVGQALPILQLPAFFAKINE